MKNKRLLLTALPILLLMGCNQTNKESYIGIVSAMDSEIELLLKETSVKEERTIGGVAYHIGSLRGHPVVITRSGIGKIRASSSMTSLLDHYDIAKVIVTGVAGGVRDEEKVLDQVIGTTLIEHDYGFVEDGGFTWGGGDPGKKEPGEYYPCDARLVDLAYESAIKVMNEENVHKGLIATGDQFISSSSYCDYLEQEFDAYACEMEGAAIGKVCLNYDTPFVVLRTLSDKADGQAHQSYADFGELAAKQSSNIVLTMLKSL